MCHSVCVAVLPYAQVLPLLPLAAAVIGSSCSQSAIRAWWFKAGSVQLDGASGPFGKSAV